MYSVFEHKKIEKVLKRAPQEVKQNYLAWKRIVEWEGPRGLRLIKGFHDEALKGKWQGFRSSGLSQKWRVINRLEKKQLIVYVIEVNVHEY